MPFTFSHPAIVLPLNFLPKKWFSLTGLVIGSLTPDFEYFLRMRIQSTYSHNLDGLFWFDLPIGILLAFIFHNQVRNSLFENLPLFLKSRFSSFKDFNWNAYFKKNWLVVILSTLIGAASHILWDSFTHDHGYFVEALSLTDTIGFLGNDVPILKVLQHASTIVGGLAIAYAVYTLPKELVEDSKIDMRYWAIWAGLTLSIVAMRLLSGLNITHYGNLIVTVLSASMLAFILCPWLIKPKKAAS